MYLRKSQLDRDFEDASVEETLNRHRNILTEYVTRCRLNVTEVLEEVVSAEALSSRPQMMQLLELVNTGLYSGVVCMDLDRLSRGDNVDSGYIMQVLKYNHCKIYTPMKIYDLQNEQDEQYTDMKFMFSRYELKTITRRLVQGRTASAKEGKHLGSVAPYGYEKVKLQGIKGMSLKVVPEEAEVVRMIFNMYCQGIGYNTIAYKLNQMGIPSAKGRWGQTSIANILNNEVYLGKIRWGEEPVVKTIVDGKLVKTRYRSKDYQLFDGLHEAIVTQELWDTTKAVQESRSNASIHIDRTLQNPFAGLMRCSHCGSTINRNVPDKDHPTIQPWYRCTKKNKDCDCKTVPCSVVENAVVQKMKEWLDGYIIEVQNRPAKANTTVAIPIIEKELSELQAQQNKICDLLEQGVYTVPMFQKRNTVLQDQIDVLTVKLKDLKQKAKEAPKEDILIPTTHKLLDNYENMTAQEKNLLWKQVLEKITLYRSEDQVDIQIYPKLPML